MLRSALPIVLAAILCAAASSAVVSADADPATTLPGERVHHGEIPRASGPIAIDGRLDETTWETALAIDLPYEISPGENIPPPVRTTCLLSYDDRQLYVAFRALDPEPSRIRAHVADRDSVFRNDYVGVVLDPFNDGRRGFNFMVNPLGVQMDSSASDVGGAAASGFGSAALAPGEDSSWDALWTSAGRITGEGYVVEFAIPFTSLRFPRGNGIQTWGVVPYRAYPRDVMHRIRSVPRDRNRNCWFCQAGTVGGLSGMVPGRNIELTPTLTSARTDVRETPDPTLQRGRREDDLGLSARWGVTPNLSLNAALNPDFSQVEADAARLSVNRRFALFFEEKRPFFLEAADVFATPIDAVYTRTVADPEWGAKLTGKEGRNALGVFVARDRVTNVLLPGPQGSDRLSLEEENTVGVARYRRDVGESSALGVLATVREGARYHNRVFGTDGFVRLGARDTVKWQALRSDTHDPDGARSFGGNALHAEYVRSSRDWSFWAEFEQHDRGFRADAGFVPRVDTRSADAGIERLLWGNAGHWFNTLRFQLWGQRTEDTDGRLLGKMVEGTVRYDGPLQSTLLLERSVGTTTFRGQPFDADSSRLFFNVRPTGDFTSSIEVEYYNEVDFASSRPGRVFSISPGITYNIGRHLYIQVDHGFERFRRDGATLYRANVSAVRCVYQFNVRLFLRAVLQREAVAPIDAPVFDGPGPGSSFRNLLGQYLLSYKVNPQTVFFLGYSEDRGGEGTADRILRDRTFFMKLGYAFVR